MITICICTFRRAAVFDALRSLETLNGMDRLTASIVVVDNDETDKLRPDIERYAATSRFAIDYVHAPARNISIARNAALDAVRGRWAAFIDDDEVADPEWLIRLFDGADEAEVVIGKCEAVYGPSLPAWAKRCDFHSSRISGDAVNAYTGNALLDVGFIRANELSFRLDLGRTGGEDTIFFRALAEAGGRIVYRPDAIIFESVPAQRATMRWVHTRYYRAGQTHGLLCREFNRPAYANLWLTAGAKALVSAVMAILTIPGSDASRKWTARLMLHCGAVHFRFKPRILEEYG